MTLGELRRELAKQLGLDTVTSDGLVSYWDKELLNSAARDLSKELKIPRGTVVANGSDYTGLDTMVISLPSGAKVMSVYATPDILVPLYDVNEVAYTTDKLPYTAKSGHIAIVGSDEVTILKPEWAEWPDIVKVNYFYLAPDMVNDSDQPWDGQYAPYHNLIALKAAIEALPRFDPGERETAIRLAEIKEEYKSQKEEFVEGELTPTITLNNGFFVMYPRVRRWP